MSILAEQGLTIADIALVGRFSFESLTMTVILWVPAKFHGDLFIVDVGMTLTLLLDISDSG